MSKLSAKLKEELLALIPPMIFFFVALNLVAIVRMLMLKGTGIPLSTPLQAFVAALILAKAVLIADMLPLINRYPNKPLVYNVAWKTAIYLALATVIHYLERLVDFWKAAGSFAAANQKLLAVIVWQHFWAVEILLAMLILSYSTVTELGRVIGADKLRQIFFSPQAAVHG
ncbi:MAG TPA: hypothetical protein VKG63_06440 [Steroidobacteraceae bacterium]|nr:hypothetical protein [Steroidobacteraceae bacterium]